MTRFPFGKSQHLLKSREFAAIFTRRCVGRHRCLTMFAAPNDLGWTRIGLSVSKKKGGNAVQRNRLKRLLREAFRLTQHDLPPGLDLVLIPESGTASTLAEFQQALRNLSWRLSRKLGPKVDESVRDSN